MSDLVTIDPAAALERAADPGEFVVLCLERGKTWLAEALEHGDLDALVNAKGFAETLRVATMQKQLGKDAELSATELVRRAERCIGLGIRAGQEAGQIRSVGQVVTKANQWGRIGDDLDKTISNNMASPGDYLNNADERASVYAMTDHVTDDQFEASLAEAKDEQNLSRANVIRKVKGEKPAPAARSEWHRKARHIDPARVIEETISTLEGIVSGLNIIDGCGDEIDPEQRAYWADALTQPLADIKLFIRKELRK